MSSGGGGGHEAPRLLDLMIFHKAIENDSSVEIKHWHYFVST